MGVELTFYIIVQGVLLFEQMSVEDQGDLKLVQGWKLTSPA